MSSNNADQSGVLHDAAAVFTGTCVNFDLVADGAKERNGQLVTRIDLGGLHDLA